jgi:hypothetical protein
MDKYSEAEMTKIARAEFKRGKEEALAETQKKVEELKKELKQCAIMQWKGGHHTTFDLETKPLMDIIDKIFGVRNER